MDLQFIVLSFIAGVLTVLAPCIFPLLPILLGSTTPGAKQLNRAFTVILSLLVSITLITILIHGTANALNLNQGVLRLISGVVLCTIGIFTVFPKAWDRLSIKLRLGISTNRFLGKAVSKNGKTKDILTGAALGPVFSSCSPTYGVIIASILPQTFAVGLLYLLWYIVGLGLILFLIAILGQRFTSKFTWATDANGWFKRGIGILFICVGIAVLFNFDKSFETWILQTNIYNRLVEFELELNR